ncbi:MAG: zinc ribbon domain-containing protein [Planctomycetota bacterium]
MEIRDELDKLKKLQEIDGRIEQNREDRDRLKLDIEQQEERIDKLKSDLQEAREERQRCMKEADKRELNVQEAEEQNEKLKVQRNSTKNREQYQSMGQTIQSNLADIQKWETEELELLDKADEMKKRWEQINEKIEAEESKLEDIQDRVREKTEQYNEKIEELQQERESLLDDIEPDVLEAYRKISRSKGTKALVHVKQRICQGCHTSIPRQSENALLKNDELVYCDNCGRILMLDKHNATF